MENLQEILKQALTFLGKKLDTLKPKDSIDVKIEGAELVTIKGEKGDSIKGERGDPGAPGKDGKDSKVPGPRGIPGKDGKDSKVPGPKGEPGKDGNDSIVPGPPGIPGNPGRDGSPDTGEEIIGKINKDKSGKVIKKEHVEGLSDIESMAKTAEANSRFGMRAAGDTVYLADLSSQTNGVLKTFTIPVFRRAIMVTCSDFPTVLFLNNGFTVAGGTLTLTTDSAPSSGSMLGFLYII